MKLIQAPSTSHRKCHQYPVLVPFTSLAPKLEHRVEWRQDSTDEALPVLSTRHSSLAASEKSFVKLLQMRTFYNIPPVTQQQEIMVLLQSASLSNKALTLQPWSQPTWVNVP